MRGFYTIAVLLLVVGGLNWGLVGLLNLDLVAMVFGAMSLLTKIVYTIVGVSAVYVLIIKLSEKK
jgi:hypothetical protein